MNGSLPAATQVDLRRQPVEDVLQRVERALDVRVDRGALVRKRRSLGGRTEQGTWVRIERRGFERIGSQGWNGAEAAAVLHGVAMPQWHRGLAWREPGEPVMWRADELELIASPSVAKGALLLEDPGLDAATLWGNALAVPALTARVHRERRADLESRDGKLMSLYFLSKIVGPHAYEEDPLLPPARQQAERLLADLRS
ncbi:hypothetical protein [Streptomyces sp. NPDC089919]|uniref:hypothetical protein n=1 Tax=Streptomyces sp. NPDC089919 TaxID=3155188 RepID=UPI00341B02D0